MANDNADGAWGVIRNFPQWMQIILAIFGMLFLGYVVFGVSFLLIKRDMDVQISLTGFKATRPETTFEKNCRMASQEASARDQSFNSEILALQAQVAIKDHDLGDIRQKCLAARAGCKTETTHSTGAFATFANPHGDYEMALNNTAKERKALQSRIEAKEQERAQWQQRLDQRCLRAEAPP
jgi:hypothetical protein